MNTYHGDDIRNMVHMKFWKSWWNMGKTWFLMVSKTIIDIDMAGGFDGQAGMKSRF